MDPSSSSAHAPRRGHLKRLSLSVGSSSGSGSPARDAYSPSSTPDKSLYTRSPASENVMSSRDSISPLHRSLGRRQRPMSMHAGASSPLSAGNTSLASLDASLSSPAGPAHVGPSTPATMTRDHAAVDDNLTSHDSVAHPLSASTSTPIHDSTLSPGSSTDSPSSVRSSAGRRSILGRSAHARRQSSISYARAPSNDSPSASSSTPRTSLTAIRDEDEEENEDASPSPMPIAQTPSRTSLDRQTSDMPYANEAAGQPSLAGTSPSSVNEMNIGPGARSSDLLTFIAKKERKCLDLREELQRHESELAALKKKWEMVIQREMSASTASPSLSNMSPSHSTGSASGAASLFSSLTSTLTASTSSSSSLSSSTAIGEGITSPSPKSNTSSSRRLLTSRHSISVTSSSNGAPYFGGGADLSPQTSPLSAMNGTQPAASLDVQKIAKSWLGGVMKSASTVLEGLAPLPPSQNDLHTVTEEEEPEENEEHYQRRNQREQDRTSAGHPSSDNRRPHNRKESTATNGTFTSEFSSPSSSCEDGQFSSGESASRSSSVSSLHSNGNNKEGDTTPIATPVLPYGNTANTPRAGDEERDLWALSGGDFEDEPAREKRENMERNRIDNAKGSPRKEASSRSSEDAVDSGLYPKSGSRPTANHGRRRSTAFELGGAWGAMVGKKWNEMASQITANETIRNSSKKAIGIMEGFEKSLNDAITPDSYEQQQREDHYNNTQLMLVNGELIPTGDWSPVSEPRQLDMERRDSEKSLPSGIGGPSSWSALLGRTSSRTTPKSPQLEFAWQQQQEGRVYNGEHVSPSLSNGSSKMTRSIMDEENEEERDPLNVSRTAVQSRTASLSPTPMTAQERIQASRAKHAKRMSMPVNSTSKAPSPVQQEKRTTGLGLEGVDENEEEDEGAWGW